MRVSEIIDGEDLLDLFLCHGAKDVASDATETVDCVVGHKGKLKIEGLNRYAENLNIQLRSGGVAILPMGNMLEADATAGVESWTLSIEHCVVRACIALLVAWSVFSRLFSRFTRARVEWVGANTPGASKTFGDFADYLVVFAVPEHVGLKSYLPLSALLAKLSLITSSDASTHFRPDCKAGWGLNLR